mmetsp:Transcript_90118/g.233744  ORF Transcript_90118/g.233744 Transcript_90118/m.233744 type:complete len:217 (-) Transcript_90118:155-805(-)
MRRSSRTPTMRMQRHPWSLSCTARQSLRRPMRVLTVGMEPASCCHPARLLPPRNHLAVGATLVGFGRRAALSLAAATATREGQLKALAALWAPPSWPPPSGLWRPWKSRSLRMTTALAAWWAPPSRKPPAGLWRPWRNRLPRMPTMPTALAALRVAPSRPLPDSLWRPWRRRLPWMATVPMAPAALRVPPSRPPPAGLWRPWRRRLPWMTTVPMAL